MSKITLDRDSRHKSAIMFDDKSYVLRNYDGTKTTKGNTLTGRSNEQFTLDFISTAIDHIFAETPEKIVNEYKYWKTKIECQMMGASEVCKRQTLSMSLEQYRNKIAAGQNCISQYEAALSADREFIKGDVIQTWYEEPEPIVKEFKTARADKKVVPNLSGYEVVRLRKEFNGNIYRDHYLDRLVKTCKKLLVVLGIDRYKKYFPNQTIYKTDKRKLLPVLGLEKLLEHYPDYNITKSCVDKMDEKDLEYFKEIQPEKYQKVVDS